LTLITAHEPVDAATKLRGEYMPLPLRLPCVDHGREVRPGTKHRYAGYAFLSNKVRKRILDLIFQTKSPHIGSSYSCVELLVSLYFKFLRTSPENRFSPERDRFILSKGHACPALYAVLSERGFLSDEILEGFARNGGTLEWHPHQNLEIGIEVSSGSLGHGLSIAAGMAFAAKKDGEGYRVYVMLGDGELNEGSVWEAIMFAAHHKLDNLVAIVDYNRMQALGHGKDIIELGPLSKKFSAFNWAAKDIAGHSFSDIFRVFSAIPFSKGKPSAIIAHTVKGKGVSFMENSLLWHYRTPDQNEYELAHEELCP
jgi:transketolase